IVGERGDLGFGVGLLGEFGERIVCVGPVPHVGIVRFDLAPARVVGVCDGVARRVLRGQQIATTIIAIVRGVAQRVGDRVWQAQIVGKCGGGLPLVVSGGACQRIIGVGRVAAV